jgi:hypothetical protein
MKFTASYATFLAGLRDLQAKESPMTDTSTKEGQTQRIAEIIHEHAMKSKHKGDYHFRAAESWDATGDYIPGQDDGEPPQGAYEQNQ